LILRKFEILPRRVATPPTRGARQPACRRPAWPDPLSLVRRPLEPAAPLKFAGKFR